MTKPASKIRKGDLIVVHGVTVRVDGRVKWDAAMVKINFSDCGNGLPTLYMSPNHTNAVIAALMFKHDARVELADVKA